MDIIKAVAEHTNTLEANWVQESGDEMCLYNDVDRMMAYVVVDLVNGVEINTQSYDGQEEPDDYNDDDGLTDVEADAMTLGSVGWGTDEDYGYYGE